jgi:hypothetical protein
MPIQALSVVQKLPILTSVQQIELSSLYEKIDNWINTQDWEYNTCRSLDFGYKLSSRFARHLYEAYTKAGWRVNIHRTVKPYGDVGDEITGITLIAPPRPQ